MYDESVTKNITITNNNLVNGSPHHVFYGTKQQGNLILVNVDEENGMSELAWKKYTIKETDFRIKTGTLTTPQPIDLTNGVKVIKIVSTQHENFVGEILDDEYTENSDGTYTYKLQDLSREYQAKFDMIVNGADIYRVLQTLLTRGLIRINTKITDQIRKNYENVWSGLRPQGLYKQDLWGNILNINTMTYTPKLIIRNTSYIEAIRDLTIGYMRYIDVYFNDKGILQIEPFSMDEWKNTGLYLTTDEVASRKFKFDITNAITQAAIESTDSGFVGNTYGSSDVLGLNLSVFFGSLTDMTSNPNASNVTIKGSSSNKKNTASKTVKKNKDNPYGNKKKKVWINADNGSGAKKTAIANALKKNGWSVHVGATDSNAHYRDYWNVTKDYQCYITLYNGFCAGTIREAYSSKIQNVLKKKGVVLVPMWDSAGWTNPNGMKPYRNGDFSKYTAKRAWDDNFSSSNPTIKNVGQWLKNNKAKYCCSPTTDGLIKQFLAGGYFAYTGK